MPSTAPADFDCVFQNCFKPYPAQSLNNSRSEATNIIFVVRHMNTMATMRLLQAKVRAHAA